MKTATQFPQLSAIALAVLALGAHCQALAQDSAPAAAGSSAAQNAPATPTAVQKEIQQVVVTGTASASGTRKIDAAFSITTANEEQLKANLGAVGQQRRSVGRPNAVIEKIDVVESAQLAKLGEPGELFARGHG